MDYYDTNQRILKTQSVFDLAKIESMQGKWLAQKREMINHQAQHKTVITLEELKVNIKMDKHSFTPSRIDRGL